MKTTIKFLAVLALVIAGFSQHSTALAASNFRFRGDSADAFFSSFDGCVLTETFVFASEGVFQNPPGRGTPSSGISLFISQYDYCTETQVLSAEGFAGLAPSDFQVGNKLGSASLNTTVEMFDYVSWSYLQVHVDLTWTAVGPLSRESSNDHFNFPGCKVHSRFRGSFRAAEVSGSITDGVTNYTPELGWGSIAAVKQGDVVIGCN